MKMRRISGRRVLKIFWKKVRNWFSGHDKKYVENPLCCYYYI